MSAQNVPQGDSDAVQPGEIGLREVQQHVRELESALANANAVRQQLEKALVSERTLLHTVIDNLPAFIYFKDPQSRFILNNVAHAHSLGRLPQDMIGKTDAEFFPADLATAFYEDEQRILRSGQTLIDREEHSLGHEGQPIWALTTKVPVRDDEGHIIGIVGITQDITQRKQAEQELRAARDQLEQKVDQRTAELVKANANLREQIARREQAERALAEERNLLRTLIDNVPDYIFVKDNAGRFLISNLAHARAANVTPDELVGKSAFDVFPPHLATQFDADDRAIMQSGEALINAERRSVDASGAERMVLSTKVPLWNAQGKVIGLVGISRDITEYRLAEQALAAERALLRTLIDNLPDNIFIKDVQGRIVIDNIAHRHLLGFASLEEAVGKSDFDCFTPDLASKYGADEQAVIQSGQPIVNREEPTVDRAGNQRWLLTTKLPLQTSGGNISGIIGINHDITERKQAEEKLLEERALLRTLIDALPDYIYVKDRQGRFVINNLAQVAILGAGCLEQTLGKTDFDFFPHDEAARYFADEQAVIESNQPLLHLEERGTDRATGRVRWTDTTKVPLRDQSGQVIGIVGIGHDVTRRKETQETLRQSEAAEREQRVLAEALRDSAMALASTPEPQTVMSRILDNLARVIPYETANIMLIEGDVARVAYWRGYPATMAAFLEALRLPLETRNLRDMLTNRVSQVIEDTTQYPGWLPIPELAWIRANAGIPIVAHDQVIGFLNVDSPEPGAFQACHADSLQAFAAQAATAIENAQLYDQIRQHTIDLEKRVAQRTAELEAALEQQKELGTLKSRFISMASHEFRTPMTTILSSANLLELGLDKMTVERRIKHFAKIKLSVGHMTQLLDDVLILGKADAGRLEFHPSPVDLEALCREFVEDIQATDTVNHTIRFFYEGECTSAVVDRELLGHVILNLLSNAVKYSPTGSDVLFRLHCGDGQAVFHIQDHGIGIPEDDQKHLFETFFRSNNVHQIPGTGLGLVIVRRSVEAQGGSIRFDSKVGVGTTFVITVPTRPEVTQ